MQIFRGRDTLQHPLTHPVIAIGNFDGVHLGHQKILSLAVEEAQARDGHSIAFTFKPHPQVALNPQRKLQLLSTYSEKIEIFKQLGLDFTIEEPFSREFSSTEPKRFFTDILLDQLKAECIVVGYDFGFGRNRGGHLDLLTELCAYANVQLIIVPPFSLHGEVTSSSRIRAYLLEGKIAEANLLLGRKFSYRGIVTHGDARGRKLEFPTANLTLEDKLTLPFGVYATWAKLGDCSFPSVTNVGIRPTFQAADAASMPEPIVETHILDQSLDLYGHTLEVSFVCRIRSEKKFSHLEDLKRQIQEDALAAKKLLSSSTP
jgi:riboflavin kinase/FMN adenylyltransferase